MGLTLVELNSCHQQQGSGIIDVGGVGNLYPLLVRLGGGQKPPVLGNSGGRSGELFPSLIALRCREAVHLVVGVPLLVRQQILEDVEGLGEVGALCASEAVGTVPGSVKLQCTGWDWGRVALLVVACMRERERQHLAPTSSDCKEQRVTCVLLSLMSVRVLMIKSGVTADTQKL